MAIIKEIQAGITEKLKSGVSFKEVILFNYLDGQAPPNGLELNSSQMERICFEAFFNPGDKPSDLIIGVQKQTPIKGLHYSNNLIELLAMAKHDFAFEEDRLRNYVTNTSLKESYIIHLIFPEISIQNGIRILDPIDQLVYNIFVKRQYNNLGEAVVNAIESATELLEWLVIKKAIQEAYSLHPNSELERDLSEVIKLYQGIKDFYRKKLQFFYGILTFLISLTIAFTVFYAIVKYWDELNLEPYLTAISVCLGILSYAIGIVIYKNRPSMKLFYGNFIEGRLNTKFKKYGINRLDLDNIEEKYIKKNYA